jgi:hypothetical protein
VLDKTEVDRASNWYIPQVVIEHENNPTLKKLIEDFRKVCLLAVPLRVFIGYGTNKPDARARGNDLRKFYSHYGLRQITGGETLLMLGWPQQTTPLQWERWLLVSEGNDWQPLS